MSEQSSRAYLAGVALGKALVEMVNLMYQQNTARNFFSGVLTELGKSKRYFGKRRTPKSSKVAQRSTKPNNERDVICHDNLHFDIAVIPGTDKYRCYKCGWEGKLTPVS